MILSLGISIIFMVTIPGGVRGANEGQSILDKAVRDAKVITIGELSTVGYRADPAALVQAQLDKLAEKLGNTVTFYYYGNYGKTDRKKYIADAKQSFKDFAMEKLGYTEQGINADLVYDPEVLTDKLNNLWDEAFITAIKRVKVAKKNGQAKDGEYWKVPEA